MIRSIGDCDTDNLTLAFGFVLSSSYTNAKIEFVLGGNQAKA